MSTRTIIEINHDYLKDLCDRPNELRLWLNDFGHYSMQEQAERAPNGIRVLAQRHHSDKLTLEVK